MRCAVLLIVAACAEPVAGPPELSLGVGLDVFVPVTDGDSVPIETGTQGGTVVFGGVSAKNLDPDEIELVFTIARSAARSTKRTRSGSCTAISSRRTSTSAAA